MSNIVRFDCFELDLESGELRKRGTRLKLRTQSFQTLALLLERAGRLVTREELCDRLWHNEVFVDFDNNLNIVVGRLREALGDSADRPRFVETLPKRGYRFIGKVLEGGNNSGPTADKVNSKRDIVAYGEYLRGRLAMLGTLESYNAAREHFERAIKRDPEFAPAHDAMAELYWELGYLGIMAPRKAFSSGLAYALRALEIDNTRAETHALVAQFHKSFEYNWDEVHREMEIARQLDPTSGVVRMRYAISELVPHGRLDEAITELEAALALDPMSLWACAWLGIVLVLHRELERALDVSRKLLELDPPMTWGYFVQGVAYRYQGKLESAIAAHRKAVEYSGGLACTIGWLGQTLASAGNTSEARELLRQLHQKNLKSYVPPTSIAWIHLGLGEVDEAFEWLSRSVEECDALILPIKSYGFLDPLRPDPRFAELLRRMNLES